MDIRKTATIIAICLGISIAVVLWITPILKLSIELVGAIMGGLVGGIISSIMWGLTPDTIREAKKQTHTQLLANVFEKLKYVQAVQETDKKLQLKITKSVNQFIETEKKAHRKIAGSILLSKPDLFFPLDELEYWDWAKTHLQDKEYEPVWNKFKTITDKIAEYNKLVGVDDQSLAQKWEEIRRIREEFSDDLHKLIQNLRGGAELKGKCVLGY